MPQRVVAAVVKPDTIGDKDVIVDVGLEPGTKGLHGHDHPWSGILALVSSVSVASDLGGGPAGKDSVDERAYLAMESGVELKAFAQTHLLGKRDHQVAVVDFRQLLGQRVGQDLGAAVDTGRANPGFATVRDRHMQIAVGTVEERQTVARVSTAHQAVNDLLGLTGQRPVAVSEARVVGLEKRLGVIDQNPPEGTLVELALPVKGGQTAGRHPLCLSGFRRPMVNWVRPFLCQ